MDTLLYDDYKQNGLIFFIIKSLNVFKPDFVYIFGKKQDLIKFGVDSVIFNRSYLMTDPDDNYLLIRTPVANIPKKHITKDIIREIVSSAKNKMNHVYTEPSLRIDKTLFGQTTEVSMYLKGKEILEKIN